MTRLLHLPLELLDMIIHLAIVSRSVTRTLRLKLVCSKSCIVQDLNPFPPSLPLPNTNSRISLSNPTEPFYHSVDRTLLHTKILNGNDFTEPYRTWGPYPHHRPANKLWHDYLVFRCRDKRDESSAFCVWIRETADALVRHLHLQHDTDPGVHVPAWDEVLDKLCWLVMGFDQTGSNCMRYYGGSWHGQVWCRYRDSWGWREVREWSERQLPYKYGSDRTQSINNAGQNMLSAATYLGCTSLVRELLDRGGHDPTHCDGLFPSPMYIAAWTGQADLLLLFQEHLLPDYEERRHLDGHLDTHSYSWRFHFGPGSLHGAAARGDMDMVRLCLYPPSRAMRAAPDGGEEDQRNKADAEMLIFGYKPGSIPRNSKLGTYIERAMQRTRSPTVYDYLLSLLDEASPDPNPAAIGIPQTEMLTRHLAAMAGAGDIAMVRHMLRLGADPSLKDSSSIKPLVRAIGTCNFDVVNLLLSCGADPNGREKFATCLGSAYSTSFATHLLAAVKIGSVAMVRRMLDAGAEAQLLDEEVRALRYAVQMEHTAMVELLLDGGIVSSDIAKALALWTAEKTGLESMAELLRSKGAELTPWVSPPRPWVLPSRMMRKGDGWYQDIARQQLETITWTPPPRRMLSLPLSRLPY